MAADKLFQSTPARGGRLRMLRAGTHRRGDG